MSESSMPALVLVQQEILNGQHERLIESESLIKKLRTKCKEAGCCANIDCTISSLYAIGYWMCKNCKIRYCNICYSQFGKLLCQLCSAKFKTPPYVGRRYWLCLGCCQNYSTCPDCR